MKRWSEAALGHVEDSSIDAFIEDLIAVCRKHNKSLGHEDSHGAFLVEKLNEDNIGWLRAAQVAA